MRLTRAHLMTVLVPAILAGALAVSSVRATAALEDKSLKLSGCLVRGEGDGAGYLLVNTPIAPSLQGADEKHLAPGSVGTAGTFANIFYWLDGDKDLDKNIGHRVEIEGDTKGDVKDGELKVDRKDNWTEMTVKSDGRTMKARVPNASIVGSGHDDHDVKVLVRKIDVDHVKMLAADCQ